jgi:phospholipase C
MKAAEAIEQVIVLMMENQSFDKILGFVKPVGALTGQEFFLNSNGEKVFVKPGADLHTNNLPDHPHSFKAIMDGMYEPGSDYAGNPEGRGFLKAAFPENNAAGEKAYLECYDSENRQLPAITTLAKQFVTCNRWFASLPGPTGPNRLFAHCATSGGYTGAHFEKDSLYPPKEMKSIFESLDKAGKSWKIYHDDSLATSLALPYVQSKPSQSISIKEYYEDVKNNTLANYSFLVPVLEANSQHGGTDNMKAGDDLIKHVFNALQSNKSLWKKSLFIITYDEAGGQFDTVMPDVFVPAPLSFKNENWPPDDHTDFHFNMLGPRVPSLLISPWLDAGLNETIYEHATLPASLKLLWDLKSNGPDGFLTERDKWANDVFSTNTWRSSPREDRIEFPE